MTSPWVSVWGQALACQGPCTLPGKEAMATLRTKRPEKLFGGTNYASLDAFSDKVLAVLKDQATRGQVFKKTEQEARQRCPDLVVASLGAQRKDKPG